MKTICKITALSLVVASGAASGQTIEALQTSPALTFRMPTSISAVCRTIAAAGANLWNSSGARITFTNGGTYTAKVGRTLGSAISVEPGSMIPDLPANAQAYTDRRFTTYDPAKGYWRTDSFNVIVNETTLSGGGFYCGSTTKIGAGATPSRTADFQDIISYEFGHGIGLVHDSVVYPTMLYSPVYQTYSMRALSSRDRAGAVSIMGAKLHLYSPYCRWCLRAHVLHQR